MKSIIAAVLFTISIIPLQRTLAGGQCIDSNAGAGVSSQDCAQFDGTDRATCETPNGGVACTWQTPTLVTTSIPKPFDLLLADPRFLKALEEANASGKTKGAQVFYPEFNSEAPTSPSSIKHTLEIKVEGFARTGRFSSTPVRIGKIVIEYIRPAGGEFVRSIVFVPINP